MTTTSHAGSHRYPWWDRRGPVAAILYVPYAVALLAVCAIPVADHAAITVPGRAGAGIFLAGCVVGAIIARVRGDLEFVTVVAPLVVATLLALSAWLVLVWLTSAVVDPSSLVPILAPVGAGVVLATSIAPRGFR